MEYEPDLVNLVQSYEEITKIAFYHGEAINK